jgi:archaellum component FlaC
MTANIQLFKDIKLNLHNYERVGIYRGRSIDVITTKSGCWERFKFIVLRFLGFINDDHVTVQKFLAKIESAENVKVLSLQEETLADQTTKINTLKQVFDDLQTQSKTLSSSIEDKKRTNASLESRNGELDAAHKQLSQREADLKDKINKLQSQSSALAGDVQAYQDHLAEAQEELNTVKAELKKLMPKKERLSKEVPELEERLVNIREQATIEKLEEREKRLQNIEALENKAAELKAEKDKVDAVLPGLKQEIAELRSLQVRLERVRKEASKETIEAKEKALNELEIRQRRLEELHAQKIEHISKKLRDTGLPKMLDIFILGFEQVSEKYVPEGKYDNLCGEIVEIFLHAKSCDNEGVLLNLLDDLNELKKKPAQLAHHRFLIDSLEVILQLKWVSLTI